MRSCCGAGRGGEDPRENEGRTAETQLSARERSCSDQLRPGWSARMTLSEEVLDTMIMLVCSGPAE